MFFRKFLFTLIFIGGASAFAEGDQGQQAFVSWAKESLVPVELTYADKNKSGLKAAAQVVGDASIVAFSEGPHAAKEPLEYRNELFKYLVEHHGFTAIAIETGMTEGRVVHDYVHGRGGELKEVVSQGISWSMDKFPQNEALIRWMHAYNADDANKQKINFYGFDVPGSPGNHMASRGVRTALDEALSFLDSVNKTAAEQFRDRLAPYYERITVNFAAPTTQQYSHFSAEERNAVTTIVNELVAWVAKNETAYSAATSPERYQWAYRDAIAAQQVDNWLQNLAKVDPGALFSPGALVDIHNGRDLAMADNFDWILGQEGPQGKVLVFGAVAHLATSPFTSAPGATKESVPFGVYLKQRHGDKLVTFGHILGGGSLGCQGFTMRAEPAPAGTVEAAAATLGHTGFLLDIGNISGEAGNWLSKPHQFWTGMSFNVVESFDALFYTDQITPACP